MIVQFRDATPQQVRESLVASVGGTVVGGLRPSVGEGFYVIRVSDDSTGVAVRDAVQLLDTSSHIGIVAPNHLRTDVVTYRRPDDGQNRRPSDWRLDPDSAFGPSGGELWAASAIRAPFAWGCANGAGVRVAVLDYGHHVNSELAGRINSASVSHPSQSSGLDMHGELVASVLGATANNGTGVAGIASGSQLLLLDPAEYVNGSIKYSNGYVQVSDLTVYNQMVQARIHRTQVLNISLGSDRTSNPGAAKLADEAKFVSNFLDALTDYRTVPAPLIVVSAGNAGNNASAQWGSYGLLADSLPNSTLVVAAASRTLQAPNSNATAGGHIDIWAPGRDVAAFSAATGPVTVSGASFAAPLVAGTAALMLELDSTLTAPELRQLIRESGQNIRSINSQPFLDSYEALKRVAWRTGTPLCGNRLWSPGEGVLAAQRQPGNNEVLFAVPGDPYDVAYVNAHHGGRRIETMFQHRFVLTGSTWAPGTWSPDLLAEYSGAFKGSGAWFQDHDDSVSTRVDAQLSGSVVTLNLTIDHLRGGLPSRVVSTQVPVSLARSLTGQCVREELDTLNVYQCTATDSAGTTEQLAGFGGLGSSSNHLHALDPQGRFILVPLVTTRVISTFGALWEPCFGNAGAFPEVRCRRVSILYSSSIRTQLIRMSVATGAGFVINTSSALAEGSVGDEVWWLSINEEGSEVALQVGNVNGAGSGVCSNGRHLWLTIPKTQSVPSLPAFVVNIPGSTVCDATVDGAGTSASVRSVP